MDRNHRKSVASIREASLTSVLSFNKQHKKSPSDNETNAELRALREDSVLKATKKNLIAQRLKKFLQSRPTQDDLYQRNILASPYQSLPPKLSIFYKIQQAFEKAQAAQVEGIFRVSGNSENIRNIWASIAAEAPNYAGATPHDIAGVMKMYIRQLPTPLIPTELFQSFVDAQKMEGDVHRQAAMRILLNYLPEDNLLLLRALIIFLERVTHHVAINKMNAHNLSVCFGPNVLKSPKDGAGVLTDIETQCSVVETMILNRVSIFGESHTGATPHAASAHARAALANLPPPIASPRDGTSISPRENSSSSLKNTAFANLPPPPPAPAAGTLPPPPVLTPPLTSSPGAPVVVKKVLGTGRPPAMTAPPPVAQNIAPSFHHLPPPILPPPPPLPLDSSFNDSLPLPPPPVAPTVRITTASPQTTYIPPAELEDDENEELYLSLLDDLDEGDKPALIKKLAGYFTSDPRGFRKFLRDAIGVEGIIAILELVVL